MYANGTIAAFVAYQALNLVAGGRNLLQHQLPCRDAILVSAICQSEALPGAASSCLENHILPCPLSPFIKRAAFHIHNAHNLRTCCLTGQRAHSNL